jgi:hypothetical protein
MEQEKYIFIFTFLRNHYEALLSGALLAPLGAQSEAGIFSGGRYRLLCRKEHSK